MDLENIRTQGAGWTPWQKSLLKPVGLLWVVVQEGVFRYPVLTSPDAHAVESVLSGRNPVGMCAVDDHHILVSFSDVNAAQTEVVGSVALFEVTQDGQLVKVAEKAGFQFDYFTTAVTAFRGRGYVADLDRELIGFSLDPARFGDDIIENVLPHELFNSNSDFRQWYCSGIAFAPCQ